MPNKTNKNKSKNNKSIFKKSVKRNKKIRKNKIFKLTKLKLQIGGNYTNIASSITDFIEIIKKFEEFEKSSRNSTIHKETGFDFANLEDNTYYRKLISYTPCSIDLRMNKESPYEYVFDSEFNLVQTRQRINIENEIILGSDDYIICQSMDDGSYKIIMKNNTNYYSDLCPTQVQLVSLNTENLRDTGHSLMLILNNNEPKSFSVIYPNGGDTIVGKNLSEETFSKMLEQIMIMKGYVYSKINYPPCQIMSVLFPNSCHLWSLLYCELIIRFNLDETIDFFTRTSPMDLDKLISKYATYIMKVIQKINRTIKEDVFIYSNYYIKADELFEKIYAIYRKQVIEPRTIKILRYKNIKISFVRGRDYDWELELLSKTNTKYKILSKDSHKLQTLSIFIKAFPDNFKEILEKYDSNELNMLTSKI